MIIKARNQTIMRSILLLLIFCTVSGSLTAQKKPKLSLAEKSLKSGDYATARDIVDQASEFEKLKDDPKTWFLRGRVYMTIDTTNANIVDNPTEIAMASFNKAKEMGDVTKLYTTDAIGLPKPYDQHINDYWAFFFNKGAIAYGDKVFDEAVVQFEKSQVVIPSDTNGYTNAGLAAHNGQLWESAKRNYKLGIENGVRSLDILNLYIVILTAEDKDLEGALVVTRQAREFYPNNNELARSEINLLIQLEKADEAKENLLKQLETEPDNASLHFILGVLLEEVKDLEGAKAAYLNAIKADDANYNANFNVGVMYINEATEIIKERNNLGISDADLDKAEELDPLIDQKLRDALPQWEKIHRLNDQDASAMETLRYIYTQLKLMDKAEAIDAKLEAMGG